MSFLDNFSQWSKLDPKNQRVNPTKMNFPTVNHKKIKKAMQTFIYFFNNIDLYKTLVISVCFMKPKDLIACQMTGFFFPYK